MRLNIPAEELTDETEIVERTAADGETYYGVRLRLATHTALPASHLTFWVGHDDEGGHDFDHVAEVLDSMIARLTEIAVKVTGTEVEGLTFDGLKFPRPTLVDMDT